MYGLPDFTVGSALRRTFDIVKRHGGTLLTLAAVLYALPVAVLGFVALSSGIPNADAIQAAAAAHRPVPDLRLFFGFMALSGVVQTVGLILATAATIRIAYDGLYGRTASFGDGVGTALRVLPVNFVLLLVSGIATGLASLLLIVPGVMLFCRWSVAIPALVVERTGILGSLGRSRDLTRNHRWSILGFLLVIALVNFVVFLVVGIGGATLGVAVSGTAGLVIRTFVGVVATAAVSALNGASAAALYFELRRAGEGGLAVETADAFA